VSERDESTPVAELTADATVAAVTTGSRSVTDIVSGLLERIQERDGDVGAFRVIDEGAVRRRAKELDDEIAGPLYGLAVGVKDVIDTADLPTGYGSPLFSDHRPTEDAGVVARLKEAGALVLGKTESTEFALFQPTRTHNPADLDRTPGGSSSGSAAAVAAGMVPIALGTQTAGSVIRPGAYCGVYAYKPALGWTPTKGIWRLADHFDTVGVFSRSAADLAIVYEALRASPGPASPAHPMAGRPFPSRRRAAAVLFGEEWATLEGDARDALRYVADLLADRGWDVSEMRMPAAWRHLPEHHNTVMSVEVARNLRAALGGRVELISESARAIVERGDQCPALEYLAALDATEQARTVLTPLAGSVDIILAPSALGVAPEGLGFTGDPVMCRPWTLLGLPAANIPAYRRSDGLPVGTQAIAPRLDDVRFLDDLVSIEAVLANKE
jgi:Asp-tRNA(Asn)/Glu-tRNA(Gln) amidotransferase A subunit family amidase